MPCGQCSVHAETMRDTKECSGGWDAAPALCLVRLNEICTLNGLRQTLATGIRNWAVAAGSRRGRQTRAFPSPPYPFPRVTAATKTTTTTTTTTFVAVHTNWKKKKREQNGGTTLAPEQKKQ